MSATRRVLRPVAALVAAAFVLGLAGGATAAPGAGTGLPADIGRLGTAAIGSMPGSVASAVAVRPPTPDRPVPRNLAPSLAAAPKDYPLPYFDGCHVNETGKVTGAACVYGDVHSRTTIALFGDSHALAWFPALEWVAVHQGWRLLSLTMSACSPADIRNWVPAWHRVSTECTAWREQAIARLTQERPQIIVVGGTRGFEVADANGNVLSGAARTAAWQAGMQSTLQRLTAAAGRVVVIADTPISRVDPPTCLAQHPSSVLACATPVSTAINATWLATERQAARQGGAGFIDPSLWVCPSSPCPAVIGSVLVFRNAGHLTATFAATMARKMEAAIFSAL